jgi:hypothetical protein
MAIVDVSIRVVDDQIVPAPVEGVLVQVFDLTDAFISEGLTDALGEVTISLLGETPGVTYTVRFFKVGASCEPISIDVTDPPSPPNEFEATASIGMSGSLVWLHTISDDVVPVDIPDCRLRLFDALDNYITEFQTNDDGEESMVLQGSASPGTTYVARLLKPGWEFVEGPTQQFQVIDPLPIGATNIFDFVAHTCRLPESTDPDFCMVSGYVMLPSGIPPQGVKLRFLPRPQEPATILSGGAGQSTPAIVQRKILMGDFYATTNSSGYVEVSLPRGGIFELDILGWSDALWPSQAAIMIPNAASVALEDVLFPYVASVTVGLTSPIVVAVGGYVETTIVLTGSNGQVVNSKSLIERFVSLTLADTAKAAVQITEAGLLRLDGRAVGSTSLTFARVDDTYVPRVPDVPALFAPAILVEVTA